MKTHEQQKASQDGQKKGAPPQDFPPLLIKAGLVFSESVPLTELLCKPKLLPIRSAALERLEHLDEQINKKRREDEAAAVAAPSGGALPLIAESLVARMDYSEFRG